MEVPGSYWLERDETEKKKKKQLKSTCRREYYPGLWVDVGFCYFFIRNLRTAVQLRLRERFL